VVVLVTRDIYLSGAVICGSSVEALSWSRVVSRLVGDRFKLIIVIRALIAPYSLASVTPDAPIPLPLPTFYCT